MTSAQIGIVYYADDPDKKVFRRVQESFAGEFDDAARLAAIQADETTLGVDKTRTAIMEMITANDQRASAFTVTPGAPATTNGIDVNGNPWPPVDDEGSG